MSRPAAFASRLCRSISTFAAAGALGLLAACGGGGGTATVEPGPGPGPGPGTGTCAGTATSNGDCLLTAQRLPGFPHDIDVYVPQGATRAIVVLHGGLGRNYSIAATLGLNTNVVSGNPNPPTAATVDWTWLRANKMIAVFPQGQAAPGTLDATTWNNHAMDSGQNDVAFLQQLAAYVRTTFGVTRVGLAGHSMGGTMTNRMWCESPSTFDAYVAMAGPASAYYLGAGTACQPPTAARYMGIIGSTDTVMQDADWTAQRWTIWPLLSSTPGFVEPDVIGEWVQHGFRAGRRCGETPLLDAKTTASNTETWTACGGAIVMNRVLGSDHGIDQMERLRNRRMVDDIAGFLGNP